MPPTSPDTDIVARGIEELRTVLTMDVGISEIVVRSGRREPSLILVRMDRSPVEDINRALASTLPDVEDALLRGAIVSIDGIRHRTRLLPVHYTTQTAL